jgi:hypothetical protein
MKDAFKIKAKTAARGAAIDAARALIRPTLLRQPVVAKVFNQLPPAVRADARISLYSSADVVFISVFLHQLDSFKDKRLTSLLEKFADWKSQSHDCTLSTEPNRDYIFNRAFTWDHDKRSIAYKKLTKDGGQAPEVFDISIGVYAFVKADSDSCRIVVKKHEEVVTKEERFIVCD